MVAEMRSSYAMDALPMQIRPMATTDLEQVVAVERLCHAHPWSAELFQRELENPVSNVDLLFWGERLGGFLCSWIIAGELEILNVATAPECRRRGVAAALMQHVFDRARAHGVTSAFLEVRLANSGAIALYRKFGFTVVARRPGYYADGEDALLMQWRR